MPNYFFDLIQVSLGNKLSIESIPSEEEWALIFDMACKQSLVSVVLEGVNQLVEDGLLQKPPARILLKWIGIQQQTIAGNKLQNQRAKELCEIFKRAGFKISILKGQGTALYYNHPEQRQCGDIDIWVKGDRDEILYFARKCGYNVGHVDLKHSEIEFFDDIPVEVHFLPSWMYNPTTNTKLQTFFNTHSNKQFENFDIEAGFTHTTIDFDLVYSIVHIYRHVFSEGIGLRQVMDYYYILQHSTRKQRDEAFGVLNSLKMSSFVGGVMWILCNGFGMKEDFMLCPANVEHGKYLLSEIMRAGNFGHYDDRLQRINVEKRLTRGISQFKRNLRFLKYYPSEVLWSPLWKIWHWCWRKMKGYL